jgi:hypothetical protein
VETKAVAVAVTLTERGGHGGKTVGGVVKSMIVTASDVLEGIVVAGEIGAHPHRKDLGDQSGTL